MAHLLRPFLFPPLTKSETNVSALHFTSLQILVHAVSPGILMFRKGWGALTPPPDTTGFPAYYHLPGAVPRTAPGTHESLRKC